MRRLLLLALTFLLVTPVPAPAVGTAPEDPGRRADGPAATAVPLPRLSAPPGGLHGHPLWDSWHDLEPFGYTESELLVSGTATSADGASTAPYTTRVVITRPQQRRDFNGTVLLDWVNVTAQFENAVDTLEAREMLLREGVAFVHVSAQKAGLCCTPLTPQVWDPVRYADLDHPGDAYAADMFAQVARAVRTRRVGSVRPLGPLRVRRVLAAGQSQSASRLHTFVNARPDGSGVIDGFLIHGGGGLEYGPRLRVPVLQMNSDWAESTGTPDDDPRFRLWEVAGSAHADFFIGHQQVFGQAPRVLDQPPKDRAGYEALIETAGNYGQVPDLLQAACTVAGATMPTRYAVSSALHRLDRWVRTGVAPAPTPRYRYSPDGQTPLRDADHNVRGGIRLPPMQVPVASYRSDDCQLGGITVPFSDQELAQRYPTFGDYQRRMRLATDRSVRRGWLLPADAVDMMRRVCAVRSRYPSADQGRCRGYRPPRFPRH
ncbi:hypothetical protein I601_2318 [Nocardioides dokdonensis FR1436]|uniref:Alpha/beta hydrolase domain-containing protein n=1 Tax=Nocardioides dokdonensis FR1436 TaxID=1300347 RepID=A0A1A9GM49_9ACTN|nr:alpha/beta hydrolase domain-containing protein [Nocardioides dokdonensis]ANH38742.1 hypothetical protein I601_2318 [Nocardioides dokdonensis FR1436]